jgi:HK97 family phage portal protein
MTTWLDSLNSAVTKLLAPFGGMEMRATGTGSALTTPRYQLDTPRWLDNNIKTYRQAFATQTAVYACVAARSRGVASATLRVYEERDGDRTELPAHPLRLLMQRPNPLLSEAEFLVMTQTMMDATGFCLLEKERAGAGNVIGLWHLRSDWLKEIRRRNAASDWQYIVPGNEPVVLPAEDVIVIAGGPATDLGATGMSPIAVALREIGIDAALTDFLKLFVDKGGVPPYALVSPNGVKDQAEADYLRGLFEQSYGGFRNWTKTAILSGGLDVKKIGTSIDELAYPELRSLTESHICMVFGVPPIIAGIQAGLDASTYSNYEQARRAFFEDTIAALWAKLDGALTRGLLSEFTDEATITIEFDTSAVPALQQDQGALWTRVADMLGRGGMTLNQAQLALGLPGFGEAGDVLYLPMATQPIRPDDLVILADESAAPPAPIPAALAEAATSANTPAPSDESAPNGVAQEGSAKGAPRPSMRLVTVPLETRDRIATTNRRNVNRVAAKYAPRIAKLFRRQGEVVASAYAKRSQPADMEVAPFLVDPQPADMAHAPFPVNTRTLQDIDFDALDDELAKELRALYEATGRLAFVTAGKQLDEPIDWSLSNPKIRQTLLQLGRRIVGIGETTRLDVARVITDGMSEGLTTPQIADAIRGLYSETYRNRSMAIARTESQVSYNLATADAYAETGIVQAMMCHDNAAHTEGYGAQDGLSCAERNGVITDVDKVDIHIFSEHPNGTLAVSPLLVTPLGTP